MLAREERELESLKIQKSRGEGKEGRGGKRKGRGQWERKKGRGGNGGEGVAGEKKEGKGRRGGERRGNGGDKVERKRGGKTNGREGKEGERRREMGEKVIEEMKTLKRGWSSPAFNNFIPGGDGLLEHWCAGVDKRGEISIEERDLIEVRSRLKIGCSKEE